MMTNFKNILGLKSFYLQTKIEIKERRKRKNKKR